MRNIKTYNIEVETITPLHIGDGQVVNHTEWTNFRDDGYNYVAIVDPEKILKIIGTERVGQWVNTIDEGKSVADFMSRCASNTRPNQYAKRIIFIPQGQMKDTDTLKTCIHDGCGHAYLPGSSTKGALRTVVFSQLAPKKITKDMLDKDERRVKSTAARPIEDNIFGKKTSDIFKYVRVGDAIFEEECEIAIKESNLNIRPSYDNLMDNRMEQWVEVVEDARKATLRLQLDVEGISHCRNNDIVKILSSPENLFKLVNKHTIGLLEDEVEIWKEEQKYKSGATQYLDNIEELIGKVKGCHGNSCLLRIGHGSGWRFTTGAWAEDFNDDDWDRLVESARPKNYKYRGMMFPKSRRIEKYHQSLMGFVKLTIQ